MHISLIGMSNIGKSHWAHELAVSAGYEHVCCDGLVETKLADELARQGYKGLHEVAKWMGQPYDPQYPYTSRKYMVREREVMLDIIERLRAEPEKPLVIDTTGSIIYVGDDVIRELKTLTRVVYLEATAAHAEKLFQRFIEHPKPVIWGESFKPPADESLEEIAERRKAHLLAYHTARLKQDGLDHKTTISGKAVAPGDDQVLQKMLRDCYPALLTYRAERYAACADIRVPFEKHSAQGASWEQLIGEA